MRREALRVAANRDEVLDRTPTHPRRGSTSRREQRSLLARDRRSRSGRAARDRVQHVGRTRLRAQGRCGDARLALLASGSRTRPRSEHHPGGGLEIAIASSNDSVYVLTSSGTRVPGWPRPLELTPGNGRVNSPVLASLRRHLGDPSLCVVIASAQGQLIAYGPAGNVLPGWSSVQLGAATEASPAVADLDGDGSLEVLIGAEDQPAFHDARRWADSQTSRSGHARDLDFTGRRPTSWSRAGRGLHVADRDPPERHGGPCSPRQLAHGRFGPHSRRTAVPSPPRSQRAPRSGRTTNPFNP
jgi:hypothetical protein